MIVFQLFPFYVMRHWSRYGVNGALKMKFMNYMNLVGLYTYLGILVH